MGKIRKIFKYKKFLAFALAVAIGTVGLFKYKNSKTYSSSKKIKTYTVSRKNVREELILSGEVKADRQVNLRFKTSGKLVWVGVKVGDKVKKGQAIASLDRRELEKDLKKYLNYYLKTRWDFEQTKEDYKDFEVWGISEEEKNRIKRIVEKAQFDLNNSVIDVELRDIALKDAILISPIDGIVTKVEVPVAGVFITPANAEFEITDPQSLYFSVAADQTEVIKLSEGLEGDLVFDVMPEKSFKGRIDMISFVPKEGETGTVYEVKVSIDNRVLSNLRVGMTGDFKIITGEKENVVAVPLNYVMEDKKGFYVYVLERKKFKKRYIKGEEFADYFIVSSGLSAGEKVVLKLSK